MEDSDPTPQNKTEGKGQEETTFSQDQVNEIVSKRLAEANAKSEKRLKDEVSKALAEAERQSKLSEAEREKEFKAIQAAPSIGGTIPINARGTAQILYMNAQKRFSRIILVVFPDSLII